MYGFCLWFGIRITGSTMAEPHIPWNEAGWRDLLLLLRSYLRPFVAGTLVIGNHGRAFAMSERTCEHLDTFREPVDEILNEVLLVLIGLEVLIVTVTDRSFMVTMTYAVAEFSILVRRLTLKRFIRSGQQASEA